MVLSVHRHGRNDIRKENEARSFRQTGGEGLKISQI